jgi:hypothetical protein
MMTVVIRQRDALLSAAAAEFQDEAELEQVLADQVALLQGAADYPLAPVARQVDLADAGTLDLLCVNENGLPVAVEVKLARNGESRREVVAQIVDYLSALTTLTIDELDSEVDGKLEAALKSFDLPENRESFERRWQACGANLRAGLARIVVALDQAPADLQRIVLFLSERSNLDIRLVTISKFLEPRVGTLYVPSLLVTSEGEPSPRPSPRPPADAVSPDAFMAKWESTFGSDAAAAWRAFVEAVKRSGIAGLELGHYRNGVPYIYLSNPSVGPLRVLRLNDKKPEVRDLLNTGSIWDANPRAAGGRERFRRTLTDNVRGAVVAGAAGRIYAPVRALEEQRHVVIRAISDLAKEIAVAAGT